MGPMSSTTPVDVVSRMHSVGVCRAALPVSVTGEKLSDGLVGGGAGPVNVGGGRLLSGGVDELGSLGGVALPDGGELVIVPLTSWQKQ